MDFFLQTLTAWVRCAQTMKNNVIRNSGVWDKKREKRCDFFCQKRKCFQWRRVKNELYWCRWLIFLLIFYLNVIFEKKQPICLLQPMLLFLNSIPPQKTLMTQGNFKLFGIFGSEFKISMLQFMTKKISICYYAVIPLAENFLLEKVSFLHHIFPLT